MAPESGNGTYITPEVLPISEHQNLINAQAGLYGVTKEVRAE